MEQDLSNRCSKCDHEFEPEELLKRIDDAKEASMRFREETMQVEILISCPNPECEANVLKDWEECPVCHSIIPIENIKIHH